MAPKTKKCYEIHIQKESEFSIALQWLDSHELVTFINTKLDECVSVGIVIPDVGEQEEIRLSEIKNCCFNEITVVADGNMKTALFDEVIADTMSFGKIIIDATLSDDIKTDVHMCIFDIKQKGQWTHLIDKDKVAICLNYDSCDLVYDKPTDPSLNYVYYNIAEPNKEEFTIVLTEFKLVLFIEILIKLYDNVSVSITEEECISNTTWKIPNITKATLTNVVSVSNETDSLSLTSVNSVTTVIRCK